jgi:nitrite reductase/ring-hydroxylating ferredoxin subunit
LADIQAFLYTEWNGTRALHPRGAFKAEKGTIFSTEWLPVCAEGQIAQPGEFLSATVGGWSVVAVRDATGAPRVLRNACRHQNMPVVGTPSGRCERFRCRFHGWTYDLAGKFLTAPAQVSPADPQAADNDLLSLTVASGTGMVFFSFTKQAVAPDLGGPLPAYGGTIVTDISCNWKVVVEQLLGWRAEPSTDFVWRSPLLALRRTGTKAIVEQVVPHTFLRTRLFTHMFGDEVDGERLAAGAIKDVCERLQADRVAGIPAPQDRVLLGQFHRDLARAYAEASP